MPIPRACWILIIKTITSLGRPPEEVPYGYKTFYDTDDDGFLYILETSSFAVKKYDRNLIPTDSIYAPVARLLILGNDRLNARLEVSYELRQFINQYLPDTKPVARQFIVDDQKRFWIRI